MPWTYAQYYWANVGICIGLTVASLLFMSFLLLARPDTFYLFIELMFNIKSEIDRTPKDEQKNQKEEPKTSPKPVTLNLYDEDSFTFDESNKCSCRPSQGSKCPCSPCDGCPIKIGILIMSTAVLTATLIVFFGGIALIIIDVDTNGKCPIDGEMDCYSLSVNHTYFFCNSSDTRIDSSLGRTVCYRWWQQDLGTTDVLNQIGLCGGLIVAFGLFVLIFLRLNLYIWRREGSTGKRFRDVSDDCCCCGLDKIVRRWLKKRSLFKRFRRPELLLVWFFFIVIAVVGGAIAAFTYFSIKNTTVNGVTYSIIAAALVVTMISFPIFIAERNENKSSTKNDEENKELFKQFLVYLEEKRLGTPQQNILVAADYDTDQKPSRNISSNRIHVLPPKNSERYLSTQ